MARISIASCVAVADRIANASDPAFSPDVRPFTLFSLDMSECYVPQADGGKWKPAMARVPGQKTSERQLWRVEPTSPDRVQVIDNNERAERVAALDRNYNPEHGNIEEYSFDVPDYVTFATNLAEACHRILGEAPKFLLDDDGEADIY